MLNSTLLISERCKTPSSFLNGPTPASFSFIFVFPNTHYNFYNVKNCPSSIRCQDSNSLPLENESPPIITRPGLPSMTPSYLGALFVPVLQPSKCFFKVVGGQSLACQITSPFNKKIGWFCKAIFLILFAKTTQLIVEWRSYLASQWLLFN